MSIEQLEQADHVDVHADLWPGHRVAALRASLAAIRSATQASFGALFSVAPPPGLAADELERAALRVAERLRDRPLAAYHRARLPADAVASTDDRARAIDAFVDRLTLAPAAARPAHVHELLALGLTPAVVVTLAQAVAFQNYLVRVLAGLRALASAGVGEPGPPPTDEPVAGRNTLAATPPSKGRFTTETLSWASWLPTVDAARATPEQLAVLDESNAQARSSAYYLTLVHAPGVLRERSRLFNAIMYGPGKLPRAERELATVAVSRINGCTYCASVHARLFGQLSKEPEVIERLLEEGVNAPLLPRRRAIVDLAVALTANPPELHRGRLAAARAAGLDDAEILHVIHAAAIFAWANRLMQTLGEPEGPGQD